MTFLTFASQQLFSRTVRINASHGLSGLTVTKSSGLAEIGRKISYLTRLGQKPGGAGGALTWIWDKAKSLAGFLVGVVKAITFTATAIWSWVSQRLMQLWAFNWNVSDKELKDGMTARNTQLMAIWGGVFGQGVGWLTGIAIGAGVAMLVPVIGGAALARSVALGAGREALDELLPQIWQALRQTAGTVANNAVMNSYIGFRSLIKSLPLDALSAILGADRAKWVKDKWGAQGGPNMSFATQVENFIEKIPNQGVQAFLEEAVDEFWDGFIESGFVIAQEIDNAYSQARKAVQESLGPERTIEIVPDQNAPDEKLAVMSMPQTLALATVQQTLNTQRLVYNRDVGSIIGQPAMTLGRANWMLRQLTVTFHSLEKPPWREKDGSVCRRANYTIPDVKHGLTWREIKTACSPYSWGKYRATAVLDNRRQMAVYGATPTEAKEKLKELLTLSTAKIIRLSITEEDEITVRRKKTTTRMYPAFACLIGRKNTLTATGRVDLAGNTYTEDLVRFALWTAAEPRDMPTLY